MGIVAQTHRVPDPAPSSAPAGLPLRRRTFQAMGTTCEIQYAAPGGDAQAARFDAEAVAWVEAFEAKFSRFRPGSLLSRINAAAGTGWTAVDAEMEDMFKLCDTLVFMTQGVLDPTALPLIRLWNWKADNPQVPDTPRIEAARQLVGWSKVKRGPGRVLLPEAGMALDFGGFGKEFAVDRVSQIASANGIANVLVDFGHDIRVLGAPPGRPAWHIGLEDPTRPGTAAGSVALSGSCAIASSGDYLRCFTRDGKRYGHIIDPRTGRPVANGCVQATVIAPSCLQAGVLSTTAFVLGMEKGIEFIQSCPGAEGIVLSEKARAQTRGFHRHVVND
jgi:FAD:protein FMN transferase